MYATTAFKLLIVSTEFTASAQNHRPTLPEPSLPRPTLPRPSLLRPSLPAPGPVCTCMARLTPMDHVNVIGIAFPAYELQCAPRKVSADTLLAVRLLCLHMLIVIVSV